MPLTIRLTRPAFAEEVNPGDLVTREGVQYEVVETRRRADTVELAALRRGSSATRRVVFRYAADNGPDAEVEVDAPDDVHQAAVAAYQGDGFDHDGNVWRVVVE